MFRELINNVRKEEAISNNILHMTANENILSRTALSFLQSDLSGRYDFGYIKKMIGLKGCKKGSLMVRNLNGVHDLEFEACKLCNEIFSTEYIDFNPLSGIHATLSLILNTTDVGDIVLVLPKDIYGHATTLPMLKKCGRMAIEIPIKENYDIDFEKLESIIAENIPKAVLFDYANPLGGLPLRKIRSMLPDKTLMIFDASHVMGLIAGKVFQSPINEGCDIILGNTHKTFFGPHKAFIGYKDHDFGKAITDAISSSTLSTRHTERAICLFIATLEMSMYREAYAQQIIRNSRALSWHLANKGFDVFQKDNDYPETHMIILEANSKMEPYKACELLIESNITTNAKILFGRSVLRLGVQEVTRHGMKENEMKIIADFYERIILNKENIINEVTAFKYQYQDIEYSLDDRI